MCASVLIPLRVLTDDSRDVSSDFLSPLWKRDSVVPTCRSDLDDDVPLFGLERTVDERRPDEQQTEPDPPV